jgi:hypothetical protein
MLGTHASKEEGGFRATCDVPSNQSFDNFKRRASAAYAAAVDLMCTKPAVKYFAEKLEKLGLTAISPYGRLC